MTARTARIERKTRETEIVVEVNLDGTGKAAIALPVAHARPNRAPWLYRPQREGAG
jgi:hypothetical protein